MDYKKIIKEYLAEELSADGVRVLDFIFQNCDNGTLGQVIEDVYLASQDEPSLVEMAVEEDTDLAKIIKETDASYQVHTCIRPFVSGYIILSVSGDFSDSEPKDIEFFDMDDAEHTYRIETVTDSYEDACFIKGMTRDVKYCPDLKLWSKTCSMIYDMFNNDWDSEE